MISSHQPALIQKSGLVVEWRPDHPVDPDEYDRNFEPTPVNPTGDVLDPSAYVPVDPDELAALTDAPAFAPVADPVPGPPTVPPPLLPDVANQGAPNQPPALDSDNDADESAYDDLATNADDHVLMTTVSMTKVSKVSTSTTTTKKKERRSTLSTLKTKECQSSMKRNKCRTTLSASLDTTCAIEPIQATTFFATQSTSPTIRNRISHQGSSCTRIFLGMLWLRWRPIQSSGSQ